MVAKWFGGLVAKWLDGLMDKFPGGEGRRGAGKRGGREDAVGGEVPFVKASDRPIVAVRIK